jgi:hypothetical protein
MKGLSSLLIPALPFVLLFACDDSTKSDDTGGGEEIEQISPTEGSWEFYGTAWVDDDCNGESNLSEPTDVTISDVDGDSFQMEVFFDTGDSLGQVECTHGGDDTYTCGSVTESFGESGYTIDLTGDYTLSFEDASTLSGSCALALDCSGTACDQVAASTNSGSFPCTSTQTFQAGATD